MPEHPETLAGEGWSGGSEPDTDGIGLLGMSVHGWPVRFLTRGVEEQLDGDDDFGAELAASFDPDSWVWLPGVDYAAGWRAARGTADEVNSLLAACGVERSQLRAIADTDAQGGALVRLEGALEGWMSLKELLCLAVGVRDERN
ncbi:hypothetical protein ACFRAR_13365 [Kitasatospora sp. NPDC056651]|uniref:hypothetical protein n=1 Tax=Kitasatospora sp. NPDC056651 TaxID=3345892 RepID=UPI00368E640D